MSRFLSLYACIGLCLLLIVSTCMAGCSQGHQKRDFDIPEGYAKQTLKEFARQADVEILFDLRIVDDVRTKAISGSFHPDDALALMIEETHLDFHLELETGAFAVGRRDISSGGVGGRQ